MSAAKKFEEKIETLKAEKIKYRESDDQYSWHIADAEQDGWKEALNILKREHPKL